MKLSVGFYVVRAWLTNLPKVICEEGRIAALSHTYAVKSQFVTMACPKFAPKSTPSCGPINKPHYLPHPWTHLTYDGKRHPDPIRRFSTMHWTDRCTYASTDRQIVHGKVWWLGHYATRATRPNNIMTTSNVWTISNWACDDEHRPMLITVPSNQFTRTAWIPALPPTFCNFPGGPIKFQEISSISRSCRHPGWLMAAVTKNDEVQHTSHYHPTYWKALLVRYQKSHIQGFCISPWNTV